MGYHVVRPGQFTWTTLQSANHGSEDLVVFACGYPPESGRAELLDPAAER
jgi:hypothetical protein